MKDQNWEISWSEITISSIKFSSMCSIFVSTHVQRRELKVATNKRYCTRVAKSLTEYWDVVRGITHFIRNQESVDNTFYQECNYKDIFFNVMSSSNTWTIKSSPQLFTCVMFVLLLFPRSLFYLLTDSFNLSLLRYVPCALNSPVSDYASPKFPNFVFVQNSRESGKL